jgi:hypothetical protein
VSERLISADGQRPEEEKWIVFDGNTEELASAPAGSREQEVGTQVFEMDLFAVVSNIFPEKGSLKSHPILHVKLPRSSNTSWYCFNDFVVSESSFAEVASFPGGEFGGFRHPSIVLFSTRSDLVEVATTSSNIADISSAVVIPESIFDIQSLSSVRCKRVGKLPRAGELIALDGEFVSVEQAKVSVNALGKRVASTDGRQFLARISIIDENSEGLLYILNYLLSHFY